jgi:LysR family transcriptional regulator, hydrogen peroxide-inducible genes activator
MLSTQQIQYILMLEETKNFSRAAELCFVTQPTLSMQIKKAEESLGFQIFDRNKNPLELTPWGKELLPVLFGLHSDFKEIENLRAKAKGTFKEELSIGIIPTVSSYLLPRMFHQWRDQIPTIKLNIFEMKTDELLEALQHKKIDLGILAGPVQQENFMETKLFEEEIFIYAPYEQEETIFTEKLATLKPWLLTKGNCLRTQMIHFCSLDENESVDWNFQGGNLEMLLRMVDNNGGYTLIPACYAEIVALKAPNLKKIRRKADETVPVRSIIGLQNIRNTKQQTILKVLKSIQHSFSTLENNKVVEILNWK